MQKLNIYFVFCHIFRHNKYYIKSSNEPHSPVEPYPQIEIFKHK